jgi:hypothetical protein
LKSKLSLSDYFLIASFIKLTMFSSSCSSFSGFSPVSGSSSIGDGTIGGSSIGGSSGSDIFS